MRRTSLVGALWLGALIGCLVPLTAAGQQVTGTVVDQNGKGVSGAVVSIGGQRASTDRRGEFIIEGLEDGSYKASVAADGATFDEQVEVADGELSPAVIAITLQPPTERAVGRVVDRDGNGLAGATVEFKGVKPVKTGGDGEFTIEATPGVYQVTITVGDKSETKQVTLQDGRLKPGELEVQ